MKAIVINEYGSANQLHLAEIETPRCGEHEVLVKVEAASINPVDWKIRRGDIRLLLKKSFPRVIGIDFSGVIAEVGASIKDFVPGDTVFGMANPLRNQYGSYAEYVVAEKDSIARKPEQLSFNDAASIPVAGLTAYKALQQIMELEAGDSVLINGASGGVGSFAVQIAKDLWLKTSATCSAKNVEFVRELGAETVYDYATQDISKLAFKFDGLFDVTANLRFSKVKHLLNKDCTYVTTVPSLESASAAIFTRVFGGKKSRFVLANGGAESVRQLSHLANLVVAGKIKPVISQVISLEEIPQVHEVAELGHTRGKIVIRVA